MKFARRALWALALLAAAALLVYFVRPDWVLDAEYARLASRADVELRSADVAGHRWSYYEGGSGDTLVLVHGFTGSKENWLDAARELTPHFRVILPDLPGWGASQRNDGDDYGIEAQVRRLTAFLAATSQRPVHLVGHSMGGHIAGLVAAREPARVATLVLVDSAGVRFAPNAFAQRVLAGETPFNFGTRAQFDAFMHELFEHPRWLPGRIKDVLIERNRASHAFHERVLRQISAPESAFLLEGELERIRAPVLVLWCRNDRLLDFTAIETIRARMGDVPTRLLEDCGHMPMMEKPGELAAVLNAFLAQAPR